MSAGDRKHVAVFDREDHMGEATSGGAVQAIMPSSWSMLVALRRPLHALAARCSLLASLGAGAHRGRDQIATAARALGFCVHDPAPMSGRSELMHAKKGRPRPSREVADHESVYEYFEQHGVCDGFPIVPPTPEASRPRSEQGSAPGRTSWARSRGA